jgi:predicted kinase
MQNLVIIGPSSSGKTSLAKLLETDTGRVRVSFDGTTDAGRPLSEVLPNELKKNKTPDLQIATLIRIKMIKDAMELVRQGKHFVMDDIDEEIVHMLEDTDLKYKTILILPTIAALKANVMSRNIAAMDASEERYMSAVLNQLRHFITPAQKGKGNYPVKLGDIFDAMAAERPFVSKDFVRIWMHRLIDAIYDFGFVNFNIIHPNMADKQYFTCINFKQDVNIIIAKNMKLKDIQAKLTQKFG